MYAIVDLETTGGNARSDKITEVAIYVHDGEKVVKEFTTLVNPERRIPYHITQITGINDEMVYGAPKFYEVAKQIVETLDGTTFVAHNVTFDYNFLKAEFKSLGYEFKMKKLCTVRLSRKFFPGFPSYSLGKLCKQLQIPLENRHRAAGDALATVKLFERILEKETEIEAVANKALDFEALGLHPNISKALIDGVPKETGVYYFYNAGGQLIYIGKSINIRSRVLSHLSNSKSRKAREMRQNIARIEWQITGSELIALLKESDEIKKHKPFYNRAQRRTGMVAGLFADYDLHGYITLRVGKIGANDHPVTGFPSMQEGRAYAAHLVREHELCQKLVGLYKTDSACFHYGIRRCRGACIQAEPPESYNERVSEALDTFQYQNKNVVIVDRGREKGEKALVCIRNGKYLGFGFAEPSVLSEDFDEMINYIDPLPDNRNVRQIIRSYLNHNEVERVMFF